jgi:peptidoglycan/xylan/chitin deacetylase (PgdA/CDA1 family)
MINILKNEKSVWDLYTKPEEYSNLYRDKHSRFLHKFEKNRNPFNPIVSEYLFEKGKKMKWPKGYQFGVCLTHDIDHIYPSIKYRGFTALKYGLKGLFKKSFNRMFGRDNPYWNFSEIIDLENEYDAKSTFYFLASKKDILGSNYNPKDLTDVFNVINDADCEIGLHGGYYSFNNHDAIIKEKERLEEIAKVDIKSYRNHYLRFKTPETWEVLKKAGILCDSTFAYADTFGFRNGLCHPFKPFNLNTNQTIDIWELPLNVMDLTLFKYMGLSVEDAWGKCKKLIDNVIPLHGLVTILWHNSSFDDIYRPGWGRLYEKVLDYGHSKNAWMTSSENITKWVNKNDWWK